MVQKKESKTNWHFKISMIKSVIRIIAAYMLVNVEFRVAGTLFIFAEIVGIIEELDI